MPGQETTLSANGASVAGHLALPPGGSGPGVLVIQEWWGLVPHIASVADRIAQEGFTAFAPDLYHGERTSSPDRAAKLMMGLNIATAAADLAVAGAGLRAIPATQGWPKIGVMGFCMGGLLSLYAACENPEIGACVNFYGGLPNVRPNLETLAAPVLGVFAGKDSFVTLDAVRALKSDLERLGARHEFHIYEDADHAFFNETSAAHREADARDAWEKTVAFLRRNLK
jgi:carboxymethylenebutenolidase